MRVHFIFSLQCHHRNSTPVQSTGNVYSFFMMLPKYTLTGINIFDFKNVCLLIVRAHIHNSGEPEGSLFFYLYTIFANNLAIFISLRGLFVVIIAHMRIYNITCTWRAGMYERQESRTKYFV